MDFKFDTFAAVVEHGRIEAGEQHQLLILLSGKPELILKEGNTPEKRLTVEQKSVFTIPHFYSDYDFSLRNKRQEPMHYFQACIAPHLLQEIADECATNKHVELMPSDAVIDDDLFDLCLHLKHESEDDDFARNLFIESVEQLFCIHLLRRYSEVEPKHLPYHALSKRVIRRIDEFIDENLDKAISLKALAAIAGYSVFYFTRLFKLQTGQTPYRYVIARRVEKAKTLLSSRNITVLEVAWTVGFQSPSHFAKAFFKHTGVSPSDYRRHRKMPSV